jgi:hypothetical protein
VLAPVWARAKRSAFTPGKDGARSYSLVDFIRLCVLLSYGSVLENYYYGRCDKAVDIAAEWSILPLESMAWLLPFMPDSEAETRKAFRGMQQCWNSFLGLSGSANGGGGWYVGKSGMSNGLGIIALHSHLVQPGGFVQGIEGYLWTPGEDDEQLLGPDWRTDYPSVIQLSSKQEAVVFGPAALVNHSDKSPFHFRVVACQGGSSRLLKIWNSDTSTARVEQWQELWVHYFAGDEVDEAADQAAATAEGSAPVARRRKSADRKRKKGGKGSSPASAVAASPKMEDEPTQERSVESNKARKK